MNLYTVASLNKGAGAFEHTMRCAAEFPSYQNDMTSDVAIGIIAAAIRGGLDETEIDDVIDGYFDHKTSQLLSKIKDMYHGNDRRLHLWDDKHGGGLKLHSGLAYKVTPGWTIQRPY